MFVTQPGIDYFHDLSTVNIYHHHLAVHRLGVRRMTIRRSPQRFTEFTAVVPQFHLSRKTVKYRQITVRRDYRKILFPDHRRYIARRIQYLRRSGTPFPQQLTIRTAQNVQKTVPRTKRYNIITHRRSRLKCPVYPRVAPQLSATPRIYRNKNSSTQTNIQYAIRYQSSVRYRKIRFYTPYLTPIAGDRLYRSSNRTGNRQIPVAQHTGVFILTCGMNYRPRLAYRYIAE